MPLTVSEIVDRIAKPGQDKAALNERIRHWTRERLITPIGRRNPGTGRHRTYRDTTLLDAAVLNAMADRDLQISTMRDALAVAQQMHTEWGQAKAKEGRRFFLQINSGIPTSLPPRLHWGGGEEAFIGTGFETSILIDLTQLFGRLKRERK